MRKDIQIHSKTQLNNKSDFCHQRRYRLLTSKILSTTLAFFVYVVFAPEGILSAPSKFANGQGPSSLKQLVNNKKMSKMFLEFTSNYNVLNFDP